MILLIAGIAILESMSPHPSLLLIARWNVSYNIRINKEFQNINPTPVDGENEIDFPWRMGGGLVY